MFANCKEENKLFKSGCKFIAGIDEAGRGSLAGPVTLAIVIFNKSKFQKISNLKIKDSKHLGSKKREEIYKIIKGFAAEIKVVNIDSKIIDKFNINNAISLGLQRLIKKINIAPDFVLLDGGLKISNCLRKKRSASKLRYINASNFRQKTIIKGDEKCFIIAAASIIAKVSRDNLMKRLALKYPQYEFKKHKGYGTNLHFKIIKKYGASFVHRKTFLKKLDL